MLLPEPEINIGTDNFSGGLDWLDRQHFAHRLSALLDKYASPLVIAEEGEWGSGKSHFLKFWVGEHKIKLVKNLPIFEERKSR